MILWRPHLSPYHGAQFTHQEEKIAQKHGLAYVGPQSPDAEISKSTQKVVLVTNTHIDVHALETDILERLELIIHPNSGYDAFPYEWVQEHDIPIVLGNPLRAHAVCNTILSHLLNHFSPLHAQDSWTSGRHYPRLLLSELSVLVIGHGHIGQLLEQSLRPLVKTLSVHDPLKGMHAESLRADVIIPVPGLTQSSHSLIDKNFLAGQPEHLCLINCSRGEVVVLDDLVDLLKKNPKAHAYLDVFPQEPADFSNFKNLQNLSCTSHIAGVYRHIDQATLDFIDNTLSDYRKNSTHDFRQRYHAILLNHKKEQDFR